MKTKKLFFVLILLSGLTLPTFAQNESNKKVEKDDNKEKIEVYYFHRTNRCATCIAIEDVVSKSLKQLYPKQMEKGSLVFLPLNFEEDDNDAIVDKMEITGPTLFVIKGDYNNSKDI